MKKKLICLALIATFLTACSNTDKNEVLENQKMVLPDVIETPILPEIEVQKVEETTAVSKNSVKNSAALKRFVNSEVLEHGNIGFYAMELNSGKVVDKHREGAALVPASVLKVLTGATALEVLGADSVLETKLLYDGIISKDGVLKGDIYIVGGGDPTLGSDGISLDREAFLKDWVNAVKRAGIKSIDGNIIVLDDLFGYEGISGKWLWEDMGTSYGQGTYGISVFDNLYTLHLNTSVSGKKPEIVKIKPEIKGLVFNNEGFVTSGGKRDISVRGVPLENRRRIFGVVPQNKNGLVIQSDIPDPGLFLGQYFSQNLKAENIGFKGSVTTARLTSQRPKNPKTIAVTKSPPISEIVKILLTRSDNHYTEHLLQLIQKTRNVDIEKFWKNKGMDVHSLILRDGSGLSRGNVISAKLLTEILTYSESSLDSLLPVAGKDGTVAAFLKNTALEGKVKVKSGSMSGIQSYAGYVEKNGKKYAFTIIVNHWNGERSVLRKEIEKLLNDIF